MNTPHNTYLHTATGSSHRDQWDDPVAVTELLQVWDDFHGAAEGGLGSCLP